MIASAGIRSMHMTMRRPMRFTLGLGAALACDGALAMSVWPSAWFALARGFIAGRRAAAASIATDVAEIDAEVRAALGEIAEGQGS